MPRRTWDDICAEVGFGADDVPTLTCKDLHLVRSGQLTADDVRRQKGANMATKNSTATQPTLIDIPAVPAPTTATTKPAKKENTVEKKNTKPNFVEFAAKDVKGPEWTTTTIAMQDAAVAAVRAAYGDETDFVPVNFVKELKAQRTGKAAGKLNRNQSQIDDLAVVARDLGFTDPRFCNEHEVDDIKGGKIKDGAFGFLMYFPMGSSIKWYYVFNIEDIEYEGDEPTLVEKDEKPADKPKAKTNKTTPKPDPKLKKLEEELAAQKKANDEMRELIAAQKASTDQMTAMFTALMAKLG